MSPVRVSAGLLPYTWTDDALRVFLGHMGGPFYRNPTARGWSIIKGEFDPDDETPREAAIREWGEETGTEVPAGSWRDLSTVTQSGGKVVYAYGIEVDNPQEVTLVSSTTVRMMWPARSGRWITFPEIDEAGWRDDEQARAGLVAAQTAFLDRIADAR